MIAIPWFFAKEASMGTFILIYILTNIFSIFWVPLSGTWIDKYDRKKIFLSLTFVVGSIIAIISGMGFMMGALPLWLVGTVFIVTFLNYNIHYPCLYAFVQEITEKHKYTRMTSVLEVIGQTTTIIAGACATLLLEGTENGILNIFGFPINIGLNINPWKIHEIFLVDGLTYFLGFMIILAINYVSLTERKPESGSILTRLKTGFNFLKGEKPILWFGVLSFTAFVALLLEAFLLGVQYVQNHLHESGDVYANTKMTYSIGALTSGFFIQFLFKRMNIPKAVIWMTLGMGTVFIILSQTMSIYILFAMMFMIGILNAGIRIARITYLFKVVPNKLFGRTGSVLFLYNVSLRILLACVFLLPFFRVGNNIIYAYFITGCIVCLAGGLLILHYKTFDLSLDSN